MDAYSIYFRKQLSEPLIEKPFLKEESTPLLVDENVNIEEEFKENNI